MANAKKITQKQALDICYEMSKAFNKNDSRLGSDMYIECMIDTFQYFSVEIGDKAARHIIRNYTFLPSINEIKNVLQESDPNFKDNTPVNFYKTKKWLSLRYKVIERYGRECMSCGSSENIQVDHIKPRSKYPDLELDFDNMQILCSDCNMGKSNKSEKDWRKDEH